MDLQILFSTLIWIGVVIIILDFLLLYFKRVKTNTLWDYLLTAIGSAFILLGSIYNKLWPLIVLNSFWVVISVASIIKMKFKKKR
jgi:hypothetical protein